jgi:hypothetical protein
MKTPRFFLAAGRDLLVRPRTMRHGALQKGALVETVAQNFFQTFKVRGVGFRFLHRRGL